MASSSFSKLQATTDGSRLTWLGTHVPFPTLPSQGGFVLSENKSPNQLDALKLVHSKETLLSHNRPFVSL